MNKLEALRRTALFGELAVPELSALAEKASELQLSRGEILFLAGDEAKGLYIIAEGAVRAYRVGSDGREQIIHVETAGAVIGDLPLFDEGSYPSTVAGEQDSQLLFLRRDDVRNSFVIHPGIALAALKVLARRLRNCASLVETLSLHDVDRRLARLLIHEAQVRGTRRGTGLAVELELTHQQVASRIGSVREVVSRAFSRLQQSGLIRLDGKTLIITDQGEFRHYADGR